jgi:hypothetical protein
MLKNDIGKVKAILKIESGFFTAKKQIIKNRFFTAEKITFEKQ